MMTELVDTITDILHISQTNCTSTNDDWNHPYSYGEEQPSTLFVALINVMSSWQKMMHHHYSMLILPWLLLNSNLLTYKGNSKLPRVVLPALSISHLQIDSIFGKELNLGFDREGQSRNLGFCFCSPVFKTPAPLQWVHYRCSLVWSLIGKEEEKINMIFI